MDKHDLALNVEKDFENNFLLKGPFLLPSRNIFSL